MHIILVLFAVIVFWLFYQQRKQLHPLAALSCYFFALIINQGMSVMMTSNFKVTQDATLNELFYAMIFSRILLIPMMIVCFLNEFDRAMSFWRKSLLFFVTGCSFMLLNLWSVWQHLVDVHVKPLYFWPASAVYWVALLFFVQGFLHVFQSQLAKEVPS